MKRLGRIIKSESGAVLKVGTAVAATSFVLLAALFVVGFQNRVYPGVFVNDTDVSGKTLSEVTSIANVRKFQVRVEIVSEGIDPFEATAENIGLEYAPDKTALNAYRHGRGVSSIENIKSIVKAIFNPISYPLSFKLDDSLLNEQIVLIKSSIPNPPVNPELSLQGGSVVLSPGKSGVTIDTARLKNILLARAASGSREPIRLPVETVDPALTEMQARAAVARAEALIGKSMVFSFEGEKTVYEDKTLVSWLNPRGSYKETTLREAVLALASKVDREPQSPVFVQSGGRVVEFAPARDGVVTSQEGIFQEIVEGFRELESTGTTSAAISIPVEKQSPALTMEDVNDLGIRELVGKGSSQFRGSPSERVHNIVLSANRINGTLIPPGEIFSFNNAVGEIDKFNGYKESLIIRNGETILGDGGGVCQVSTTVFRAALDAGLEIVDRRHHSFRVGYYEQDSLPGLDATIYSPVVDLKFRNDTAHHILVQAKADTKNMKLDFEFYGTKDGRVASVSTPHITTTVPAPEPIYEDDPTKPAGVEEWVGHSSPGTAASVEYSVTKNGHVLHQDTFRSTYKPQHAKVLRGTGG